MARKSIKEQLAIKEDQVALENDEKTIRDYDDLLAGTSLNVEQRLQAIGLRAAAGARPEIRKQRRIKEDLEAADQKKFAQLEDTINVKCKENAGLVQDLMWARFLNPDLKTSLDQALERAESCRNLLSSVLAYQETAGFKKDLLIAYLKDRDIPELSNRSAALRIIITDESLNPQERRLLAFEIVQNHKGMRHLEPYCSFVERVKKDLDVSEDASLEPVSQKWNREIGDDPVELVRVAVGFTPESNEKMSWAVKILRSEYGFDDLQRLQLSDLRPSEWEREFQHIRTLKRRS